VLGLPILVFCGSTLLASALGIPSRRDFTTARLLSTLGVEMVLAAVFVPLLAARGWTFARLTPPLEPRDAVVGIGLLTLSYAAYLAAWFATGIVVGPASLAPIAQTHFTATAPAAVRVAVSLVNPIFEESLFVGYIVVALTGRRTAFVATLSVSLRVAVHLYQGALALVTIAPLGLVFVLYYARKRRLWPIIAAHAMQDLLSLLALGAT